MLGIFLDTETNGLNPFKHKLIEIAFQLIDLKTGVLQHGYQAIVTTSFSEWEKSDQESLKVNGMAWLEVKNGKKADEVGQEIQKCFQEKNIQRGEAVFICQNPSFDRIFFSQLVDPDTQEKLQWPYHWLDLASMYWMDAIGKGNSGTGQYPWETGLSKDNIATVLKLSGEVQPHRAMNGVEHLVLCYTELVGFPERVQSDI
jgi:oligoribonuclease (3'-5' exoribonuclease)